MPAPKPSGPHCRHCSILHRQELRTLTTVEWVEIDWSSPSPTLPVSDTMVWIAREDTVLGLAYLDGWDRDCWWVSANDSLSLRQISHYAEAELPQPPEKAGR